MERAEVGDGVKQDGYRRILTFDDDTSVGFGSFPFPVFHEPFTDFFCPIDCVSDGDKRREMNGWVK